MRAGLLGIVVAFVSCAAANASPLITYTLPTTCAECFSVPGAVTIDLATDTVVATNILDFPFIRNSSAGYVQLSMTEPNPILGDDGKDHWSDVLELFFSVGELSYSGFYRHFNGNSETDFSLGIHFFVAGDLVATTPLPAALPLFATGLGAMGLLVWRRRRNRTDITI